MASTSFTPNLGLCNWHSTDCPKRSDFVNDNNIIDRNLGGHLADSKIHVTADEKELFAHPYSVVTYVGDGNSTKTVPIDFEPNFAIVYQMYYPSVTLDSDGSVASRFVIVGRSFSTSDAVVIKSDSIVVKQDATPTDSVRNNFNEQGGQYVILLFH